MSIQKYKFVPKIKVRSGKFFNKSIADLYKFILKKSQGYELIDGACVPYYDYDKVFEDEKEQLSAWEPELRLCNKMLIEKFPDCSIIALDSSGFNNGKKKYVNSFHFIIRGHGYYNSGTEMFNAVGISEWDTAVYKDKGKRQLFRMPYCAKENDKRLMKRVFVTEKEIITVDKLENISDECESLEDYLVTHLGNEKACSIIKDPPESETKTAEEKKTEKDLENTKMSYPMLIPKTTSEMANKKYTEGEIKSLIMCLKPIGQEWGWNTWKTIIWSLRNIADGMNLPNLRNFAHEISKQSSKYDKTATNKIYDAVEKYNGDERIGIGSLIRQIKKENPEQFIIWKNSIQQQNAVNKFSGEKKKDLDIELLLSLFSDDDVAEYFTKTQGENYHIGIDNEIYHWEKHFWLKTDENIISTILGEDIYTTMKSKLDIHYSNNGNQKEYILLFKKISSLRNCKPRMGYIKAIIGKLKRKQFLHGENMEFDMDPDQLCFLNGVYELNNGKFRKGKRNDYNSQVVSYNWAESTPEEIESLLKIIDKIMPYEDERDCLLKTLSSTLTRRLLEYFIILTGAGRNGKDTLITGLLHATLGDDNYYSSDVKLLTSPNKSSISQEKANMDKKRAVIYGEPSKKELLQCATLKELRGCPILHGRGIYSKKTDIYNQSTNILHCNGPPELDIVDDAICNSLVMFKFHALFRTPDQMKDYPKDTEFLHKTDTYYKSPEFLSNNKLPFMNILLKYYKLLQLDNFQIIPTKSMKELTNCYFEDSDDFMNWFDEKFEKTNNENDYVKIGADVHIAYTQSELYNNLTKKEKRKCNKKHMIKDIAENPNLKMFYRKTFDKSKNNERIHANNVLIMYKIRDSDQKTDNREFASGDPNDSDDE